MKYRRINSCASVVANSVRPIAGECAVDVDSVKAAEHTLEVPGGQHRAHIGGKEVRLAGFDAGQDPQIRKLVPAARHVGQVTLDIEGGATRLAVREDPVGGIDVLGERQPRQTQLDGARAGELHRRR